MEGISDIRISGIDETRPPLIRKEPYINLYFKLIHKAPADWCDAFNHRVRNGKYPVKIDAPTGLVIETWVRKPEEIVPLFDSLRQAVSACNEDYIARVLAEASAAASNSGNTETSGEQGKLNRIIAGLDFSG